MLAVEAVEDVDVVVVEVVELVPCGKIKPLVVVVDAELTPLPPVAVAPSDPVHFAPVGQQAILFAASTVQVVPDSQQMPELPSFEQVL